MKVLMHVGDSADVFKHRKEVTDEIKVRIRAAFEAAIDSKDDTQTGDISSITFGADDHDKVKVVALGVEGGSLGWNERIRNDAFREMGAFVERYSAEDMPLDDTSTYLLMRMVMAANNTFHPFADEAVLVPTDSGDEYLTPLIPNEMLTKIAKNPEQFAIVNVNVY